MKHEENHFLFSFKNSIILDKSKELDYGYFEIKDKEFINLLDSYLKGDYKFASKLIQYHEFVNLFPEYFKRKENFNNEFYISFIQKEIKQVTILEKKLEISKFQLIDFPFKNFMENTNQLKFSKTHSEPQFLTTIVTKFPNPKAYLAVIDPKNIKVGINGIIQKKAFFLLISKLPCVVESIDIQQLVKEVSLTFTGLLVSNFLKDIMFSFLNNKDVLDVIKYHKFRKASKYLEFDAFFSTFDCSQFPSIYNGLFSFQSNQKIKSFFLQDDTYFSSRIFRSHDIVLLQEYKKQYLKKFPPFIQNTTKCLYNPIFPEYVILFLLALFLIMSCVIFSCVSFRQGNFVKGTLLSENVKQIQMFFYNSFINSILLIYFYNLASFCILGKFIKSLNFGLVDFALLCVRGAVVTFPLFEMIDEIVYETESHIQEKKSNTKNTPKTKRIIPNTFVKDFTSLKVYATWTQNKNKVIAYLRISFKNLFPSKTQKRKTIFKKHVLEIVDTSKKPIKSKPKSKKYFLHSIKYI